MCTRVFVYPAISVTVHTDPPPTQTSEPFKSSLFFPPSEIATEESGPQTAVHRLAALLLREGRPAPTAPLPASRKQDDEVKSPMWPARGTAWKLANTALSFLQLPGKTGTAPACLRTASAL